ncbi:hypothetical protein Cgig2_000193 [Carnegiea gigantea]|uniref:B3 domain-containing protein n=1 Tax=Carnegiea gigantea TaxID=171969 RepID=A0A9Q1KNB2_9CARY|nr:hypothetical protein Cgig2_000193 [Carnegiea gigantea]
MRIRRRIVSKEDFGDDLINHYSSLSPLDWLGIVAQKALEKETALSSTSFLGIPMVEREQHKPMNVIKRKLFECQPTEVEENPMVEQQFTSSENPLFKRPKLPEIEKTALKPYIPITMVEVEENAMKPVERNKAPLYPTDTQSPVLPHDFREVIFSMGGSDPVMVLQKKLFKCDVDKGQGRITMPVRECEKRLCLTEEEKQMLLVRDEKESLVGIRVKVIEPGLQERELTFKKWRYSKNSSNYVLVNSWFEVVVKNKLKDGDEIQIWAFRIDGKLAFALVKLQPSSENSSFGKSSSKDSEVDQQICFPFHWVHRRVHKETRHVISLLGGLLPNMEHQNVDLECPWSNRIASMKWYLATSGNDYDSRTMQANGTYDMVTINEVLKKTRDYGVPQMQIDLQLDGPKTEYSKTRTFRSIKQ